MPFDLGDILRKDHDGMVETIRFALGDGSQFPRPVEKSHPWCEAVTRHGVAVGDRAHGFGIENDGGKFGQQGFHGNRQIRASLNFLLQLLERKGLAEREFADGGPAKLM